MNGIVVALADIVRRWQRSLSSKRKRSRPGVTVESLEPRLAVVSWARPASPSAIMSKPVVETVLFKNRHHMGAPSTPQTTSAAGSRHAE